MAERLHKDMFMLKKSKNNVVIDYAQQASVIPPNSDESILKYH